MSQNTNININVSIKKNNVIVRVQLLKNIKTLFKFVMFEYQFSL